jgi:hypothetical protein
MVSRSVAAGCADGSTATAVSELLRGSIPIVITSHLSSPSTGWCPATGSLTSGGSMPLLSHAAGGRRPVARYVRASPQAARSVRANRPPPSARYGLQTQRPDPIQQVRSVRTVPGPDRDTEPKSN